MHKAERIVQPLNLISLKRAEENVMSVETIFGSIAFFTSVIGLLPQIIKSLQTRSTHDISMLMLVNYLVCSIAWVVYGFYTESMFVLLSNVLGLMSSLLLIVIKLNFDKVRVAHDNLIKA
tara:strand:- start:3204 stop:3563 length:360 start_codon:yes stop_codon:yes gene_type:complete